MRTTIPALLGSRTGIAQPPTQPEKTPMEEPLVSVIIPAFNASRTIARAIRSVFDQTYRNWEIIVVDDGSPDDIATPIEQFGSAVRLIRQSNCGAGSARNTGVQAGRGDLLAFLDADDYWHPEKLRHQVDALASNPSMSLCGTGHRRHPQDEITNTWPPDMKVAEPVLISDFATFFAHPYIGTPGVMMRRDLFLRLGGFRTDITAAEDIDLWLRAAYLGGVIYIPTPLFTVTLSNTSLTARYKDGTYRDNLRIIDDFCRIQRDFARSHIKVVRRVKARILANWGAEAYIRGEFESARRILLQSVRSSPTIRGTWMLAKATAKNLTNRVSTEGES